MFRPTAEIKGVTRRPTLFVIYREKPSRQKVKSYAKISFQLAGAKNDEQMSNRRRAMNTGQLK